MASAAGIMRLAHRPRPRPFGGAMAGENLPTTGPVSIGNTQESFAFH
jgi:hypothetical protein